MSRNSGTHVVCILLLGIGLGWADAEEPDLRQVLEKMKQLEATIAEQRNQIAALQQAVQGKAAAAETAAKPPAAADAGALTRDPALAAGGGAALFHDPALHGRKIKLGGYLDVSYQYAANRPYTRLNNERFLDNQDVNDFNVHLAKIYLDGTAQENGQAGFRVDLAFGTDARKFAAYDRGPGADTTPVDRLSDLEQAYVDYIIPVGHGLRLKAGKFVTPIGFEVIEAQDNWNATRSFNCGKAMPFTHTGIGLEYQVFSEWIVKGYVVNGWDNLQDNNEGKTGVFQSAWTPVKWITWTVNGAAGNEKNKGSKPEDGDEAGTRYLVSTTLLLTPWEKWSFGLEGNFGHEARAGRNDPAQPHTHAPDAAWWGVAAYLKFQFLKDWYVAGRGEYLNDRDAARTSFGALARSPQELYSGTLTLSYSPVTSFETRLEYRHDASDKRAFAGQHFADLSLGVPARGPRAWTDTQDTITLQFLYKF